ncbi:MAG: hypothetical protein E6J47_03205 [Chloroflexi bacterium]|nr:MAG: hypothetical protein E6J47_03205 [Chloroflexota bacterium]
MPRTVFRQVSMLVLVVATGCRAAVPATSPPSGSSIASAGPSAQPTLPSHFPVMPGATTTDGHGSDPGLIAAWRTDANGSRVYDFYVAGLPEAGFPIVGLYPGGSVAIIRFRGSEGAVLKLAITAAPSGAATEIELRVDAP